MSARPLVVLGLLLAIAVAPNRSVCESHLQTIGFVGRPVGARPIDLHNLVSFRLAWRTRVGPIVVNHLPVPTDGVISVLIAAVDIPGAAAQP